MLFGGYSLPEFGIHFFDIPHDLYKRFSRRVEQCGRPKHVVIFGEQVLHRIGYRYERVCATIAISSYWLYRIIRRHIPKCWYNIGSTFTCTHASTHARTHTPIQYYTIGRLGRLSFELLYLALRMAIYYLQVYA